MALLGGILGVIAGSAVGILFTEVIFSNDKSWPTWCRSCSQS